MTSAASLVHEIALDRTNSRRVPPYSTLEPLRGRRRIVTIHSHREVPKGVRGISVVLGLVVVGHPRWFLGGTALGESVVGRAHCGQRFLDVVQLRESPCAGGVQHRPLRSGEPVGSDQPLLRVRQPVVAVADPDRLARQEGVPLGPEVPVLALFRALDRDFESDTSLLV